MSGSALSAAVAMGEEKVFFARGARFAVAIGDGAGRLGVFAGLESRDSEVLDARSTGVVILLSADEAAYHAPPLAMAKAVICCLLPNTNCHAHHRVDVNIRWTSGTLL